MPKTDQARDIFRAARQNLGRRTIAKVASALSAAAIRSTQALGFRGGPTLVKFLAATGAGRGSISRVSLPSGRRIAFHGVDPYWAPYLWGRKLYEPDVQSIFRRLAPIPGKLLIDGGANIGYWTVQLSAPEFGFERFIAVEANPALIPLLEENVRANGINCTVVHAALAAQSGQTVYLGGTRNHAAAAVGATGIAVTTTNLDALIPSDVGANRMIVVKLDVEGSEIAAFEGAREIAPHAVFVVEDWSGDGFANSAYLLANGFCVIGVPAEGPGRQLKTIDQVQAFNRATNIRKGPSNVVACRPANLSRILALMT